MTKHEKAQMVGEAVNLSAREVLDVWESLKHNFTTLTTKDVTKAMARLKKAVEAPLKPGEREIVTPTGMKVKIRPLDAVTRSEGMFCLVCGRPPEEQVEPFFVASLNQAAIDRFVDFFKVETAKDPDAGKVKVIEAAHVRVDLRAFLSLPLYRRWRIYLDAGLVTASDILPAGDSRWVELLRPLKGDRKALNRFNELVRKEVEEMEGRK